MLIPFRPSFLTFSNTNIPNGYLYWSGFGLRLTWPHAEHLYNNILPGFFVSTWRKCLFPLHTPQCIIIASLEFSVIFPPPVPEGLASFFCQRLMAFLYCIYPALSMCLTPDNSLNCLRGLAIVSNLMNYLLNKLTFYI